MVKTRFESGAFHYSSVHSALGSIIRTEGLMGLTRGLGPTLARDVPFSGLYLAFYECLKAKVPTWLVASSPESAHMMAGVGAGLLASLVTQPADCVKTRMQLRPDSKLLFTLSSLYREGGMSSFTCGLAPRMLRRTMMAALAWTVYERSLRTLKLK